MGLLLLISYYQQGWYRLFLTRESEQSTDGLDVSSSPTLWGTEIHRSDSYLRGMSTYNPASSLCEVFVAQKKD